MDKFTSGSVQQAGVTLSIAVTHVSRDAIRRADLISLRRRLAGHEINVVEDYDRSGLWATVRNAWRKVIASGATHGLVLAEDMLPSIGFYESAIRALSVKPDVPVSFFTTRKKTIVEPALKSGTRWGMGPDVAWGGSVAMPVKQAVDFIDWEKANVSSDYPHDDGRIALWAIINGYKVWCTVPSILEHVGANRSTVGHGGPIARTAALYANDATDIDWTLGADSPVTCSLMIGPVTRRELKRIRSGGRPA